MHRRDGAHLLLCTSYINSRKEGQFGSFQHRLVHLYREGGIQQVSILGQSLLNELLQLRIGEDTTPRQVTEGSGILHGECIHVRQGVADESCGVHVGTLVFIV